MSSKDRRKSEKAEKLEKSSPGFITLTVPPAKLRAIFSDAKSNSSKDADEVSTPAPATPIPTKEEDSVSTPGARDSPAPAGAPLNATALNDNASDSTPNTPGGGGGGGADGTPGPSSSMAPPGISGDAKKKGVKRSAAAAGVDGNASGPGSTNGDPAAARVRSKPGPKKRAKLDDGLVESGRSGGGAGGAHKLGPKASMGAINAGLRALDRSGKPCRKWAKGGFRLKSFTGVVWEIPRWTAPTKSTSEAASGEESTTATASADGSNKENDGGKDAKEKTDNSKVNGTTNGEANGHTNGDINGKTNGEVNGNGDVDMTNATSAQPSPPAASAEPTEAPTPVAIAAA